MTQIWLIRHGESTSNAGLVTESYYQNPLTLKGESQAKNLPDQIPCSPTHIIQSSYLRAKQTAQPTCEKFPKIPVATWDVHEFITVSPQSYNNTAMSERSERGAAFWLNTDEGYRDADDSESFKDSMARVKNFKIRCESAFNDDDFVLVFCHGLFIRAFMWLHSNSPTNELPCKQRFNYYFRSLKFPNTALIKCNINRSQAQPTWSLGQIDHEHVSS